MSTKFYVGQKDYIAKLNDIDDAFNIAIAAAGNITASMVAAVSARDIAIASVNAAKASEVSAANSAASISTNAIIASNNATNATASASQALAIYGTTAAVQAALTTAASQSQLAQTAAASASSILSQDLSAVSAALHRSPNTITAMTLYDTSKDSDGGAWVDRMQHTSWANEPLNGTWLPGGFATELAARGDNLFQSGEGSASTLVNSAGTSDAAITLNGYSSSLQAPAGATQAVAYRGFTQTSGVLYTFSMLVQMDDNSLPVVGVTNTTGDLSVQVKNAVSQVSTVTLLSGSLYRIATTFTSDGTTPNIGMLRYAGQSGKSFRFTAMKLNQVGVLPSTYSASPELVSNGGFDNGTVGWGTSANYSSTASVVAGEMQVISTAANGRQLQAVSCVVGKAYSLTATGRIVTATSGAPFIGIGSDTTGNTSGSPLTFTQIYNTTSSLTFVATNATHYIVVGTSGTAGFVSAFDNISVKEVTTLATPYVPYSSQTNSFYQSSADGKFYKLGATFGTLTEVFRGNKAKFPRLSAVVAEAGNVTIYDLTEPGRPMWMRFVRVGSDITSTGALGRTIVGATTCVSMLNATLAVGSPSSAECLVLINFSKDVVSNYSVSPYSCIWPGNIAKRHMGYSMPSSMLLPAIASATVNAVALTILPDASIDHCLVGETLVAMADGMDVRLDQVKVGSIVKTHEGVGEVIKHMNQGIKEVFLFEFDNGKSITCTADHKIRTTAGWVEAGSLTDSHEIVGA